MSSVHVHQQRVHDVHQLEYDDSFAKFTMQFASLLKFFFTRYSSYRLEVC